MCTHVCVRKRAVLNHNDLHWLKLFGSLNATGRVYVWFFWSKTRLVRAPLVKRNKSSQCFIVERRGSASVRQNPPTSVTVHLQVDPIQTGSEPRAWLGGVLSDVKVHEGSQVETSRKGCDSASSLRMAAIPIAQKMCCCYRLGCTVDGTSERLLTAKRNN